MDVNAYLARQYDHPPCWAFVTDVLHAERGMSLGTFKAENASIRAIARAFRIALHNGADGFVKLPEPVDFAIALLGRSERFGFHHCGVFYRDSVLHALPSINLLQDMASLRDEYGLIEFWGRV